jgi:hypothetical protein
MKQSVFTIKGTTPLMMHNERLANPFDPITKQMKALTGKRKKTEDDLLDIAKLEWRGGIYWDEKVGVHVPGYNIHMTIVGGGKMHKLGTLIKRAVLIDEDKVELKFDGPKSLDALSADSRFVDIRSVKVGTSKVSRCRPIFPEWELSFTALYDENSLQADELRRCVEDAGRMVGLGEYRPRFGRFEVVSVS